MKKQELLRRYQQGERNFRRQDLSGQSFAGQNLAGADFSGANIRGADFTNTILRGANFTEVQGGLQPSEAILLFLFLVLIAVLLGSAAGFVGTLLNLELRTYTSPFEEITAGWAMLLLLLTFCLISVLEGIITGFGVFVLALVIAVSLVAIGPIFYTFVNPIAFAISSAIALAITIISSVTALSILAVITAIAAFRAFDIKAAIVVIATYIAAFGYIVVATNIVTSIVPVVPAVIILGCYLGWQSLQGHPKHVIFRRVAAAITARWGTSFRDADLTQADFSHAKLHNTNFDGAMLTKVCWTGTSTGKKKLSSPFKSL